MEQVIRCFIINTYVNILKRAKIIKFFLKESYSCADEKYAANGFFLVRTAAGDGGSR